MNRERSVLGLCVDVRSWEMPDVLRNRFVPDAVAPGGAVASGAVGRLGNALVPVIDRDAGRAFLKVGRGEAAAELCREAARLDWIGTRLPVPEVLSFVDGDPAYLLISALAVTPSQQWIDELGPDAAVRALARTLRVVHSLAVDDCPFQDHFTDELAEADARVRAGLVDPDAFFATTQNDTDSRARLAAGARSPAMQARRVHPRRLLYAERVDRGRAVSGIVDWGRAGAANPNRDFISVDVTLGLNLDRRWRTAFFDEYGTDRLDEQILRAYYVLDQFF